MTELPNKSVMYSVYLPAELARRFNRWKKEFEEKNPYKKSNRNERLCELVARGLDSVGAE